MLNLVNELLGAHDLSLKENLFQKLYHEISKCSNGSYEENIASLSAVRTDHLDFLNENFVSKHPLVHSKRKVTINIALEYNQNVIVSFVHFLFQLQHGWTDAEEFNEKVEDHAFRQKINPQLEFFISWLENHDHLSYNLLTAYSYSIKSCQKQALVRKHIVCSWFRWLKNLPSSNILLPKKCFNILQEILILGLTDVWSAIRKDTASRMHLALELLCEQQVNQIFSALVKICDSEPSVQEENWQAVDGAVRGIEKLISSCKYVATSSIYKDNETLPSVLIKIGRNVYKGLPDIIQEKTEEILFKLFANPQLSIRDVAGKAYSNFLNKSGYTYFIESFDKVMSHLEKQILNGKTANPFEAEGFLNAVLFIIKNIPLNYIITTWEKHWEMLSCFLQHPASTVRQTTSMIFKYIIVKDQSRPDLAKFLLQYFAKEWKVNKDILLEKNRSDCNNFQGHESGNGGKCWQWKEGCLFAYELLLKSLCTNHKYTFSSAIHRDNNFSSFDMSTKMNFKGSLHRSYNFSQSLRQRNNSTLHGRKLHKSFTIVEEDSGIEVQFESMLKMLSAENQKSLCYDDIFSIHIQSPIVDGFLERDENPTDYASENKALKWLSQQKYSSFDDILTQMVLQMIECLDHDQFELRRMSAQLLPSICDVVYRYKYEVLENIYNTSLHHLDTKLSFGAILCLLNSMKFYAKIHRATLEKLSPVKQNELKKHYWSSMTSPISKNMKYYVMKISSQVNSSCSIVSRHTCCMILLIYRICFKTEDSYDHIICSHISKSFEAVTRETQNSTSKDWKDLCELLSEIQTYILEYVTIAKITHTLLLSPTLLGVLSMPSSNAIDKQIFLSSFALMLKNIENNKSVNLSESEKNILSSCCEELAVHVENTGKFVFELDELFEIIFTLQKIIPEKFPLQRIEQAIQARIAYETKDTIRNVKNRVIREDMLSFSTTSFDSTKFSDNESSDEEGSDRQVNTDNVISEDDGDDSDWDWSSSDEANETIQDKLKEFINELRQRQS